MTYPSNGLGANDCGGPSSTDDSNPSKTDGPESTTMRTGVIISSSDNGEAINVPPNIIRGPSPPGITPPGGVLGNSGDGDDGDDGNDGSRSVQSQIPTRTVFPSSIISCTGIAVTATGNINYEDWQAIN
ncbi:MAG: hypothetical protein Q9167_003317 [Letrouitia subvulpina]